MKFFKKPLFLVLILAVFLVLFYGCQIFGGSKYTDEEKAELVGEAVVSGGALAEGSKTVTTVSTDTGGTITYDDSASRTDLSSSAYYNDTDSWGVAASYFSLTYSNLQVTVKDSDGNDVTVVINGDLHWGLNFTIDTTTGDLNGTMIFYGTTSGTVDGESFESYIIDIKYTYSYESSTKNFSGTIVGTVNGKSINNSFNYTVPGTSGA